MSDINRAPIPYGSQAVTNKSKNVTKKTIRIAVKLPQSNEDTCPEFNYKDELDAAKKKGCSKPAENGRILGMFWDDDDDGDERRIAARMEEKYGKGVAVSKKRRRGRKDDYADIGMGYDESDSFIDNTDGYDEIIPQNVTTLHGGFYINCGALEFKTDNEASDDENDGNGSSSSSSSSDESSSTAKSGKREAGSENEDVVRKKFKSDQQNGLHKTLKKKLFNSSKILKKKRISSDEVHQKTVRDLLKEKRQDLEMSVVNSDVEKTVLNEDENNVDINKKSLNSITDAIESVVKASDEPSSKERLSSQTNENSNKIVQLPESLPNNISEVINKIKFSASSAGNNTFTDQMNYLLLSLEKKCKCLGKPSKLKVYEHLSYYMKIEKKTLMQHCNQLALEDEEKKIKSMLQKLKLEIDKVMPSIITNYQKECEAVIEKRNLLQQQFPDDNEKKRSIGRPKRKFRWNDQTKKYLKDTAAMKKRSYLQQGHSKESWENELTNFLKNNVLHLWPEGWMTMTTLTKVCNKLFSDSKTAQSPSSLAVKKDIKNTVTASNSTNSSVMMPPKMVPIPVIESIVKDEIVQENHSEKNNTFYKIDFEKVQQQQQSTPSSLSSSNNLNNSKHTQEIPNSAPSNKIELIELDDLKRIKSSSFDIGHSLLKKVQQEFESKKQTTANVVVKKEDDESGGKSTFLVPPSDSDDIQKVMERLRNLQEMSSPVKSFGHSSQRKSSNHGSSSVTKSNKTTTIDLMNANYQDEFQKQLYAISNLAPQNSSKNYKCS